MKWLERSVLDIPYLCLCLSERAFVSACRHIKQHPPKHWMRKNADATCWTFTNESDPGEPAVCVVCADIVPGRDLSDVVGLMAHEARHVYEGAMRQNTGIQWAEEEIEAQFLGVITARLVADYVRQIGAHDKFSKKRKGGTK